MIIYKAMQKMKITIIVSRLKRHYYLTYSLVFALVSFLSFFFFLINGKTFIAGADGFNQYYPTYYYIGKYIRNYASVAFRRKQLPTYDFNIGFGGDIISTLNYYGFGDVFNVTSAFFPGKYSTIGYTFTVLLKLYISGISFSQYAIHAGCTRTSTFAAAFLFAFSGFSLSFGLLFPTFLTALIYLPWMMWGVEDLLYNSHFSWKLILAVTLQSMVSFYFIYMDAVFFALYIILHYVCSRNHSTFSANHYLIAFIKIVYHVIVGMMVSGVFLMPTLYEYLHSARTGESSLLKYLRQEYSISEWLERGAGVLSGPGFGAGLGLCFIAVSAIAIGIKKLIKDRKNQKNYTYNGEKPLGILLVILLAGYCIPFFGSIMNGFSYSTDRWTYLLIFVIAVMMARYLPEFGVHVKLITTVTVTSGVVCIICLWIGKGFSQSTDVRATFIIFDLTLTIAVFYQLYRENTRKCNIARSFITRYQQQTLCALSILEVVIMAALNNAPHIVGGEGYYTLFKNIYAYQEVTESGFATVSGKMSQNNTFIRTDLYDTSYGASLITGTQGTTSYFSIQNSNLQRFMNAYEISGGIQGGSFCFQGLEGRTAEEALLSATNSEEKSRNIIPFGTFFSNWCSEKDADKADPLTRNAYLLSSVVLDVTEDEAQKIADTIQRTENLTSTSSSIPYTESYYNIQASGGDLEVKTGGIIYLYLNEAVTNGNEYYVLFHNFCYKGNETLEDVRVNGKRIRLRPAGSFSGQTDEFMVMVDLTDDFLQSGKINISFQGSGEFLLDSIEVRKANQSGVYTQIENLKQHSIQNLEIRENYISGSSNEDSDSILFMSIPYSEGWSCYIDGIETHVIRADYGFSAVQIPGGVHKIEWKYRTPWLTAGESITIIGIIAIIWQNIMITINNKSI